jgi:hypothetical protein
MNERAFRLDFLVAIAALLVSALTAGALIYQTRVVADQYAATIWPYIDVSSTYTRGGETINAVNDGLGPAIIRSAQLWVDGKKVSSWGDYLVAVASEPEIHKIMVRNRAAYFSGAPVSVNVSTSSIGPATTIRAGDSFSLLKLSLGSAPPPVTQELLKHSLTIDFCYCSLNGNCWFSRATPGRYGSTEAQPVARCSSAGAITAGTFFLSLNAKVRRTAHQ